jgi:transcriptional regulator with XRE-family HTH domain
MDGRKAFGEILRDARVRQGRSQDQLAILVGLRQQSVHEIEIGVRRVSEHRVELFARALEIPRTDFIDAWVAAEGGARLDLPPDAHPLARQVFVGLAQHWDDLVRADDAVARGALSVMRWALSRVSAARAR